MRGTYSISTIKSSNTAHLFKKFIINVFSLAFVFSVVATFIFLMICIGDIQNSTLVYVTLLFFVLVTFMLCLLAISMISLIKKEIKPLLALTDCLKNNGILQPIQEPKNVSCDISNMYKYINKTLAKLKDSKDKDSWEKVSTLAVQVAHDIKSPLVALEVLGKEFDFLPEANRILVHNIIQRIQGIVNNLLVKYRTENTINVAKVENDVEMIALMLKNLVNEKKTEYMRRDISFETSISEASRDLFVALNQCQFKRCVSNLINNAVESIKQDSGCIKVKLNKDNKNAIIEVVDNGCGISQENLTKIISGEYTFGKDEGTGLGVSSTIKYIRELGGVCHIESKLNQGTTFKIELPLSNAPSFYAKSLYLKNDVTVVIVDDDASIHHVWNKRFNSNHLKVLHFYSPEELIAFLGKKSLPECVFLIDYKYVDRPQNGIDLIQQCKLDNDCYLVTNYYEDLSVRDYCKRLHIKMIPKDYAVHIPVLIGKDPSYILLDDNVSITTAWQLVAKHKGKDLRVFNKINDFNQFIFTCNKGINIYLDYDLNETINGCQLAKQLFESGYSNIYLVSGYAEDYFGHIPWIKSILPKACPF